MKYEKLRKEIEKKARFESLVQLPEKFDGMWAARATVDGHGVQGQGQSDYEALEDLVRKLNLK